MSIPKIIHQTWKNESIPAKWQALARSWREHHPAWDYRLWTDESTRAFMAEHYADFIPIYDAYPYNIERADVMRYFILNHFGGVYADLDIECLQPIDDLIAPHRGILARQSAKHAEMHDESMLVCNSFMASEPNHPYWQVVREQLEATDPRLSEELKVVHRTGPNMLQRAWEKYTGDDLHILASHITNPLIIGSPAHAYYHKTGQLPTWYKRRLMAKGTVAIHYFENSWLPPTRGELINPDPDKIEGFSFYQGMKSVGVNIENLGRNMPQIAPKCLHDERVVAFDTDGYTKSYVEPSFYWVRRIDAAENEGLYVKRGARVQVRLWAEHLRQGGERWCGRVSRFALRWLESE